MSGTNETPMDAPQKKGMSPLVIVLIVVGGLCVVGGGIVGVIVAMLVPTLQQGREAAMEMLCANHLKQLASCAMLYGDRSGTRMFPTDQDGVDAILEFAAMPGEQIKRCPSTDVEYKLVPWSVKLVESDALVLYEEQPHANGKRNVIMGDTSVQTLTEEEFQTLWDEQEQQFGKSSE